MTGILWGIPSKSPPFSQAPPFIKWLNKQPASFVFLFWNSRNLDFPAVKHLNSIRCSLLRVSEYRVTIFCHIGNSVIYRMPSHIVCRLVAGYIYDLAIAIPAKHSKSAPLPVETHTVNPDIQLNHLMSNNVAVEFRSGALLNLSTYWREWVLIFLALHQKPPGKISSRERTATQGQAMKNHSYMLKVNAWFWMDWNAPAGIRTRVVGVRVPHDWPDYTTGAGVIFLNHSGSF